MRRFLGAAGLVAVLSACGGSGSGGGDGDGPDTVEGVFVDSPVTGLEFVGEDGRGLTGDDGGFTAAGVVAFFLGEIELGSAPAAAVLTPVDLVPGAGAEEDPAANRIVTNLIRLLQTLDADGDPANGLRIPEDALAAGAGRTLVFDQPVEDFENDPEVRAYLQEALGGDEPGLTPMEPARDHLRATLDHIAEHGAPNRLPVADAGKDRTVASGDAVTLDGGASSDPDPRPETPDPIVAWHWQQTAGPVVELTEGENPALRGFTPQVAEDAELVFELTVTDDDGARASDTVTVAVTGTGGDGNTPPVAEADSFSLFADRTLVERAAASDADGDDLELSVVEEPANGSLDFAANGRFTYVPDAGFTGTDTFAFKANDGAADSEPAQVAIELRPIPVARLLAGAAKRTVTPQQRHIDGVAEPRLGGSESLQQFHLGGFGIGPLQNFPDPLRQRLTEPAGERVLETEAGPEDTWVRVLILSLRDGNGGDTEVAFVTLDAVGAGNVIQAGLKAAVHAATGLPEDNILFGQTHSHAGADLQGLWGGVPQEWIDDPLEGDGLYQKTAAAAVDAYAAQRAAELSVAQTSLPELNNYRRPAVHGDEDADTAATLLQARDDDGALLASLLQYSAHPTIIDDEAHDDVEGLDGRVPHADYILGAVEALEADGGVALYYNGPIADASSSGPGGANDYDKARNRGTALADGARGGTPRALDHALSVRHVEATLPVTNPLFVGAAALGSFNRYYDFAQVPFADIPGLGGILAGEAANLPQTAPVARTLVSRVTLGGPDGLEIVTIPGEATNTFGGYIKHLAGGTDVMLLGLTQNSFGYIVPEEEFNYVSETGDTGFVLPFTNYEEYVSLGPFTAPLLRLQAYNPLFDAPPEANLPPSLSACLGIESGDACILTDLAARPGWYQREYGKTCRENLGEDEAFCELIDPGPGGQLADACREAGAPEDFCGLLELGESPGGGDPSAPDPGLAATAAEASLRGCDLLDPAHCMMPFPSDHFTAAATPGSIQSPERGGTGRKVDINILAMPRNAAGKPVDPTEWNRNDGFSPGQMITTVVPGLAFNDDGTVPGAPPITDIAQSLFDPDTSVMVIDVDTGQRHLVWAEVDLNAPFFLPSEDLEDPTPEPPALMIRPARNFEEGHRYIVVLRDLENAAGETIPANPAFAACRDRVDTGLPVVDERCAQLERDVFAPLAEISGNNPNIDVARDEGLYLAWDFTVASRQSLTGRLLAMRDDAFGSLDGEAPAFTVDAVTSEPNDQIARRVEGRFTVPSYLIPADPAPLTDRGVQQIIAEFEARFPNEADDVVDVLELASQASLPPNRLFYDPSDGAADVPYGDGLPDRTGDIEVEYTCNIPRSALAGDAQPARASLYGHGLLGSRGEVNNTSHVASMGNAHNVMFCATDWFGFASGDIPNVVTTLLDLSLFPVIPDASQQGMLNFLFLARLLHHEQGFAAHEAFQVDEGAPLFDRSEVFYDGNSQGGILGGAVVAVSPDVHRGVLGVPGMNYSTLLRRSVDFDLYSIPLYLSYPSTLDRTFLLSFMEMVWDRSENNGYAGHLNKDPLPDVDGTPLPTKRVLLHPAYADHQVTMWSADVMARTMYAAADGSRTDRHPDEIPFDFLDPIEDRYEPDPERRGARSFDGSALVIWDEPWTGTVSDRCVGQGTPVPPIGNVPPRVGDDPHECPRREVAAQCQKSHFMHPRGAVVDVSDVETRADCPVLPPREPAPPPDDTPPDDGGDDPFAACGADPAGEDCPLAPLVGQIDPEAFAGLVEDVQECPADESGVECVIQALRTAVGDGALPGCQPKVTADTCPAGPVVDELLAGLDQPRAPGVGDHDSEVNGESYAVYIASASGETIAFQVLEPLAGSPGMDGGRYPLVLEGHGYGGSRQTAADALSDLRGAGYGVISIDQRGFGESSGTVRTMDPDFEGRDLIRILDWAEANLGWLAYAPATQDKPDTGHGLGNPLVGAIGSSYGGGYQLLLNAVDPKRRLDALVPDITWHDLRYSLNPGDVNKTGWILPLTAIGEQGSGGQQDPFIKESLIQGSATNIFPSDSLAWFNYHSPDYFCGADPDDPLVTERRTIYERLGDFPDSGVTRRRPPAVDALITQGVRDTLFNLNEAFYNYQCLSALGGDVRLYSHETGHILPFPNVGADNPLGGGDNPLALLDIAGRSCGDVPVGREAEIAWFDEKLKGIDGAADAVLGGGEICLSLGPDDAVTTDEMPVGEDYIELAGPLGSPEILAVTGAAGAAPVTVTLGSVGAEEAVLGGIPRAKLRVALPGGAVPEAPEADRDLVRPFDSILFVGIGRRGADGAGFELIDDQLQPVRGLGDFDIDLAGVAERLQPGDTLAVMIWGLHGQYPGSFSRDPSVSLVQVTGSVALPFVEGGLADAPPPGNGCQENPVGEDCPLAPVADLLDPEAVPALLNALQACGAADQPAACAFEALQDATPEPLANCRPKLTDADCPAGTVVAGVLDALDQPVAPTGGSDPNPDTLGDSYAVYLESASGETIAFQVFEPLADSPSTAGGRYPLVLQGHGYGGSRTTDPDSFGAHRGAGYGVISIDQRGFGESSGTVRVMDPDFEGRDLVQILDWAEANLDWLAYAPATDDKPDTGHGLGNPLVGAIGGSYGGGYQLLLANVDPKRRLDALVPDITWNDLRYSLNPGDVVKSGWSLALVAAGEAGAELQQDPFIKETLLQGVLTNIFPADSLAWFNYHSPDYFCGAPPRRESVYETLPDYPGSAVERREPPALDVLFTQGMPDTLFNFNEAFYNYQCLKSRGGDVRLYSHQSGHILPFPNVGAGNLTAGGGDKVCGDVALGAGMEVAWFDRHLKGDESALDGVLDPEHDVCLSLADGDAVHLEEVPVGGTEAALNGPVLARSGVAGAVPEIVPLGAVGAGGDVLAGVPRAALTVTLPGGAAPAADSPDSDLVRALDSILFLGVGVKRAGGDSFELIDDQVMPVRGLGDFEIDLVGVGERLGEGDTLGLMIWGLHGQYPESFSRDPAVSLVAVDGSVDLPLLAGNLAGGGGGDGGDDPLSACADDPAGEACPLAPLVGLLSPDTLEGCLAGDEACPLNDLLGALADGDPVGLVAALRETLAGLGECAQSEDPMVCAQATAGLVYAVANAAGLPITGPEAGRTRCDRPAGDPDPAAQPLDWQLRDLENMLCATQRLTDMAANPAFVRRHVALGVQTYVENLANQAEEPTRPVLTLGQLVPGARVTDPFRYVDDWEADARGRYQPVSFIASSGAKLEGRLFTPPADIPPPYPGIVITTGSIQGYQEMYNWAAEGLAEAGYLVLTYDVQGQGSSETFPHEPDGGIACGLDGCEGVPFQQDYNFFQGTRDALDFLLSSPASPYADAVPAADPDNPNAAGTNPHNPLWPELDRRRIGVAGHSLGASAVSVVGQERACDPATPVPQRDGCVAAIVGWDALSAIAEDDQGEPVVPLRAPALSLTAEYFFNPTPANPQDPPDYDGGLAAYEQLKAAGVDAMRVALRSSTHLEWTYVPYILPASRYGERVSMHYTLAWMDRYVKGEEDALERLTATHLDGSADASSIGAGTYDPVADANVPYRIAGDCVADRVSFYYRSAYFLSARGEGTRNVEDLRDRGCT